MYNTIIMPPEGYNPEYAGKFDAIKLPEGSNQEKPRGPNLAKLAELKAAAAAKRAEREAEQRKAEEPLIENARNNAIGLAFSIDKNALRDFNQRNAEMREGRRSIEETENANEVRAGSFPVISRTESPSVNAGVFPAIRLESSPQDRFISKAELDQLNAERIQSHEPENYPPSEQAREINILPLREMVSQQKMEKTVDDSDWVQNIKPINAAPKKAPPASGGMKGFFGRFFGGGK